MKNQRFLAIAALAVGGIAFVGCDRDQTGTTKTETRTTETRTTTANGATAADRANNAADRTGTAVGNAADKTGNAVSNAADRTGEAVSHAADKTGETLSNAAAKTKDATVAAGDKTADALGRATGTVPPAGTSSANAPDAPKIREVVSEAINAALTKNGFDNLTDRLYSGDRDRLGKFKNVDDLNAQIDQIQTAWKAKYGKEFDIKDNRENALNSQFAVITEGAAADTARLAASKTEGAGASANVSKTPSGGVQGDVAVTPPAAGAGDNAAGSRQNAAITVPGSHGLSPVIINVYYEGLLHGYKLDVPDRVDGQKLHDNLLAQLTAINNDKANWPADANEAYRLVAHRVLLALGDQSTTTGATGAK
jgi:hypothetical protein